MSQEIEMDSKFGGYCRECRGIIKQGERILWSKGNGAKHIECPQYEKSNTEEKPVSLFYYNESKVNQDFMSQDFSQWNDSKEYPYSELREKTNCQRCNCQLPIIGDIHIVQSRRVCGECF